MKTGKQEMNADDSKTTLLATRRIHEIGHALNKHDRITTTEARDSLIREMEERFDFQVGGFRSEYWWLMQPYVMSLVESSAFQIRRAGKELRGFQRFEIGLFEVVEIAKTWSRIIRIRLPDDKPFRVPTAMLDANRVFEVGQKFVAMDDHGKKLRGVHFGLRFTDVADDWIEEQVETGAWEDDETYVGFLMRTMGKAMATVGAVLDNFVEPEEFEMVDRTVLVLRPKAPFNDWVQRVDEELGNEAETNFEAGPTSYLIRDYETYAEMEDYLERHCSAFFERELLQWFTRPLLWPELDYKTFCEWFEWEFIDMVYDTEPVPPDWYD